jgi:fructose-1,6-bisphosphatase/inositol monophosphatase family enzyme
MNPATDEGKRQLLALALDAAREAARRVTLGFRKHPVIEHKGAIDLVTKYDRESERYLRDRLGAAVPFAFVGEEEGGARSPPGTWTRSTEPRTSATGIRSTACR